MPPTSVLSKNPHKDIFIVGAALARVGFEILASLRYATRDQILYAVHDMADRLRAAGPDADDGNNSGPYAAALAAELVEPGLNHSDMFFEVQTVRSSIG
jgi:hypothetical protein